MKKIFFLFIGIVISVAAISQVFQKQSTPYQWRWSLNDSTLGTPYGPTPELRRTSDLTRPGDLFTKRSPGDTSLHFWTGQRFKEVGSGGGGSTDTASLSTRINNAYYSLSAVTDTSFSINKPNGTRDTIRISGGGGVVPNLQQVTDVGNGTTNALRIILPSTAEAGSFRIAAGSQQGELLLEDPILFGTTTSYFMDSILYRGNALRFPVGPGTFALLSDIGVSGTNNANVGAFYRWLKPGTQEIKTLAVDYGILIDSTTSLDALTLFADTTGSTALAQKPWVMDQINSVATVNVDVVNKSTYTGIIGGKNLVNSSVYGDSAGQFSNGSEVNFFGTRAGYAATNAGNSNFFGFYAGESATNASSANFFGTNAGTGAANASGSNFFGFSAGSNADNAGDANMYGTAAGQSATNAAYANFFGYHAGQFADSAKNAIFIGQAAGDEEDLVYPNKTHNTGNNYSILIGSFTRTNGFRNSILLGGDTASTITYISNTADNQFMLAPNISKLRINSFDYDLTGDTLATRDWVNSGGSSSGIDNVLAVGQAFTAARTIEGAGFDFFINNANVQMESPSAATSFILNNGSGGITLSGATVNLLAVVNANSLIISAGNKLKLGSNATDLLTPANGDMFYNSATNKFRGYQNGAWTDIIGGGGVSDGDKGDITVTASGATWTIDNSVVTLAKMADVATGTVFYRKTAATGAPEVQTLATLKTDLGLTGTNSGDQTITLTGGVTGSGTGSFAATVVTNANLTGPVTSTGNATAIANGAISNAMLANAAVANLSGTNTGDQNLFSSIPVSGQTTVTANSTTTALTLVAGTNMTITTNNTTKEITLAATGGGSGLNFAQVSALMVIKY